MSSRAANIARGILKKAYGDPVLFFDWDGSFAKLLAEGEAVLAGGDLAGIVNTIYGNRLPGTITLRTGGGPEPPGQGRLFDTGEEDERFKSVRERPESRATVLSVSQTGGGISLTVVKSDFAQAENDEFLESVIDELREHDAYPPWETGEGLGETVDAYLDYGSEIPSEFYEERYNWDELVEPHNEYWAKEFRDDVRRAIAEMLDDDKIALHGGSFSGESIGEVVAKLAAEGVPSVMSPSELAEKLADTKEFKNYEEQGHEGISEIISPILDEIRETWKNRQMMRQDDKKFDAMRKALDDASVDLPPNSDVVLRMLGAFQDNGWDAISFRELAKELPEVARQERFWKAVAKGSPKLTPARLQAYLDGKNPKAAEMLPKSFGAKAVNPPTYKVIAEKDYEGYTISNVDEHMLGVAALYVEEMNEEDKTDPMKALGGQPPTTGALITDAMRQWHSSAHPLSDSRRGIGWIRYDLVEDDDGKSVMFIQEIQSDFMWAVELGAAGKTPNLGGGFPDSWKIIVPGGGFERKLAQYILKKFQGWDHYLLGNLITTARQNGVDEVVMNTSKTIKLNPASAPRAEKKLRWYDDLAKDFGFGQKQVEMYGHDEEFHSRAASRMPYHAAWRIVAGLRGRAI